ncbi:DUF1624 domain-containing protein [Segetibacter sp. 3557_3]|uniref:DUF1624 domain-containing protein n=1 Tax=Segetibacter sp. 3557_3 TaxID=2547429 RepID=UPI00105841AD|nr:heparan-alpha-glucosaminide N-acetyltransferase domain-containing protein [Segetibacter sp. 3557_3]TDH23958.1 DUF1624 domain-containing protein [Segetibacter sp. 3557_3]
MSENATLNRRVTSIDLLRGIIMVIMALDHVRDFFHESAFLDDPLNLQTTTPFLYFTRWITHFCAPIFVFLAGTSAYLMGLKRSKRQVSKFLITRGLWLILIEVTVVTLGWTFNPFFNLFVLQVIWAIGVSMLLLGILIHLPHPILVALGLLIVFGHNTIDYAEAERNGKVGLLWDLMHKGNYSFYSLTQSQTVLVVYAFLPWLGVMICGYGIGKLYGRDFDPVRRRKFLLGIGAGSLVLFFIVRLLNGYGDPAHWSVQRTPVYTVLSFLNVSKYPPSMLFVCMTIGIALIALALIENVRNKFTGWMTVYGRVPFFYYMLHIYLIHTICVIIFFLSGYGSNDIISDQVPFLFRPQQFGFSLPIVYGLWLLVIGLLYPLCRWFNRYKATHHQWWVSYL